MAVAIVLIAAKTGGLAGHRFGQHAVVAGRYSSLDLVSSLVTFFAVRHGADPADADHRFGHGKAEALAGLAQAGFIAASARRAAADGGRPLAQSPVRCARSMVGLLDQRAWRSC